MRRRASKGNADEQKKKWEKRQEWQLSQQRHFVVQSIIDLAEVREIISEKHYDYEYNKTV